MVNGASIVAVVLLGEVDCEHKWGGSIITKDWGRVTEPPRPLRVKRPTRTGDQVWLNGELRMRGKNLTFLRCFLVADHGEYREVARIACASFASDDSVVNT